MTLAAWTVLGFAAWTLLVLTVTVGVYRWSRILTGRARVGDFRADALEGEAWYRRSMRAHANCVENLPVFGAIVFALHAGHVAHPAVDAFCIAILAARVAQTTVHVGFVQTDAVAAIRFAFYFVQVVGFLALMAILVATLGARA